MKKLKKRGYLEISFSWIFALIAGVFILFLAIYVVIHLKSSSEIEIDATTAKQIGILLNPLETGFESASSNYFVLPSESRIYNKCNNEGVFGRQLIQVSQKSFNKWTETDIDVGFSNKYIFSDSYVEGKKFYLFSKPFNFPFKVSDLIIMTSSMKEYCFIEAPDEIKDEIDSLKIGNIKTENCTENKESIKVCFGSQSGCEVKINYEEGEGYVEKKGKKLYFTGSLVYGAIFSDYEVYECQIKRLMQRTEQLSNLYMDKALLVRQKGCDTNSDAELLLLINSAKSFKSSQELIQIGTLVEELNNKNEEAICKLW